jgi:hypothetical protein
MELVFAGMTLARRRTGGLRRLFGGKQDTAKLAAGITKNE